MKGYSILQAPMLSFFSGNFYRDVAKNWQGTGFLYLFVLIILVWSIRTMDGYFMLSNFFHGYVFKSLTSQMPNMKWSASKLSIDKESPYLIMGPDRTPFMLFDTSGKHKTLSDCQGARILITADTLTVESSNNEEERTILFKKIIPENFEFKQKQITNLSPVFLIAFSILFFTLGLFVYAGHVLLALLYGIAGTLMDKEKRGYTTALRMSVMAMTPSIILSSLLSLTNYKITCWGLVTVAMTLGFLYFGYHAVAKAEDATLSSNPPSAS